MKRLHAAFLTLNAILVLGAATVSAKTETILIDKDNGGEYGYSSVNEYHRETADGSFHNLSCCDPGFMRCDWHTRPVTYLIEHAETRIEAGEYSGTRSLLRLGTLITVTWEGTSLNNCKITETQETTILN